MSSKMRAYEEYIPTIEVAHSDEKYKWNYKNGYQIEFPDYGKYIEVAYIESSEKKLTCLKAGTYDFECLWSSLDKDIIAWRYANLEPFETKEMQ